MPPLSFMLLAAIVCGLFIVGAAAVEWAVEHPAGRVRQTLDVLDVLAKIFLLFILIWALWDGLRRTLHSNNYLFLSVAAAAIFCGYYWGRRRSNSTQSNGT